MTKKIIIDKGSEISVNPQGYLCSQGLKDPCPYCHHPDCYMHVTQTPGKTGPARYESTDAMQDRRVYNAAIDGIESMILAHAKAGIDIEDQRYQESVRTAVEALTNQLA